METEKAGEGGKEEDSGKPRVCETIQGSGLCNGKKKSGTGTTVGGKTDPERKRENPNQITEKGTKQGKNGPKEGGNPSNLGQGERREWKHFEAI